MSDANRLVTIDQREQGKHPLGALGLGSTASATTKTGGTFELRPAAFDTNTVFRVRDGVHGAHTAVKVAPRVTLTGPSLIPPPSAEARLSAAGARGAIVGRNKATFAGTVSPVEAGALVALQIDYSANSEQWHPVAFGRVAADGTYAITHGFRTPGEASLRAVVHPKGVNVVVAASEPLTYEVPQAQNPQLTIDSSSNPLSYGKSVTISGVASGAANQPVTLLARAGGRAFEEVAKTMTGDGGAFTFTQSPLRNTYYRVLRGSTKSVALFEGVGYALSTDAVSSTVEPGQQLSFSGTVSPVPLGQEIYLERQDPSGIGYRILDAGAVGSDGSFSISHVFSSADAGVMRIKVAGDEANLRSVTEPFTITVASSALVDASAP